MPEIAQMTDLPDAMALLDAAEASETSIPSNELVQPEPTPEPQATPPAKEGDEAPDPLSTDTRPAADKPADATNKDKVETKPGDKAKSKFSEDATRRDTSWKKLNEEKAAFKTQQDQIAAEKLAIQRERNQLAVDRAKANQKFTPEQYEQAATAKTANLSALELQADGLESRAEKLEGDGKYAEAEKAKGQAKALREQVVADKAAAKQMQDMATHLRANPDKTLEQHKATLEQHKRHYITEASKKWPEFGVENSPFQQKCVQVLQTLKQRGYDANEHPSLYYDAARLVAAETAAVRVPGMEAELGQLRAKVKELELLTAPGGGSGSVQRMPAKSAPTDADEETELRQMAVGMS